MFTSTKFKISRYLPLDALVRYQVNTTRYIERRPILSLVMTSVDDVVMCDVVTHEDPQRRHSGPSWKASAPALRQLHPVPRQRQQQWQPVRAELRKLQLALERTRTRQKQWTRQNQRSMPSLSRTPGAGVPRRLLKRGAPHAHLESFPDEASCTTFLWSTRRLIGSDPATATEYRCMDPDCDDKCCRAGKLRVITNNHSTMHYVMLSITNFDITFIFKGAHAV